MFEPVRKIKIHLRCHFEITRFFYRSIIDKKETKSAHEMKKDDDEKNRWAILIGIEILILISIWIWIETIEAIEMKKEIEIEG